MLKPVNDKINSLIKTVEVLENNIFLKNKLNKYHQVHKTSNAWIEECGENEAREELLQHLDHVLENAGNYMSYEVEVYEELKHIFEENPSKKFYAGIGSTKTPEHIQKLMKKVARKLEEMGYILRSGGAKKADKSFEEGVENDSNKEIYLPWKEFEGNKSSLYNVCENALKFAVEFHPHPQAEKILSDGQKKLLGRDAYQVLGKNLHSPSCFVICWTQDGAITDDERSIKTGGTGQAISIADHYGIPVFNLQRKEHRERLKKFVGIEDEEVIMSSSQNKISSERKLIYKKGDITKAKETFIGHGVNCQGKMGAGVAKAIRKAYPLVYTDYLRICDTDKRSKLLGKVQPVQTKDKVIFNLFTQIFYGDLHKKFNYDNFKKVAEKLVERVIDITANKSIEKKIALPKIGSGLGKGDWNRIEKILFESQKYGVEFVIYEYSDGKVQETNTNENLSKPKEHKKKKENTILECSTKGDKRFSALCSKVNVLGKSQTIEKHYQLAKRFPEKPESWRDAKGKKPTHLEIVSRKIPTELLTAWYQLLWTIYLDRNQNLVHYANKFNKFNDTFSKPRCNNQAEVIRTYVKEGRETILTKKDVQDLLVRIPDLEDELGVEIVPDYIVFDLETTGFGNWERIIEIAAVKVRNGEIIDEFQTLVNPAKRIPDKITELTGITNEMVKDAPSIFEALPKFMDFFDNKNDILVAHNSSFDVRFLNNAVEKFSYNKPSYSNEVIDILDLARKHLPNLHNHKLDTLVAHFGIELDKHHRALDDSIAETEVFLELLKLENKENLA